MDICDRFGGLQAPLLANREAYIAILDEEVLEAAVTSVGEE
jgi:hypothetical protein